MGFAVISKGSIDCPKDTPNNVFETIRDMLKEDENCHDIVNIPHTVAFEISGYNAVDYDNLKRIQSKVLELLNELNIHKEGFIIQCNEFVEACDGYFFEYEKSKEKQT
jgi:hypothetical protein